MRIQLQPLTAQAFAPFGEVLEFPARTGRSYFDACLANRRAVAMPSISLSRREDFLALPLQATVMERHEFSSQSFIPVDVCRWVVMTAPHAPQGGPDMRHARAFLSGPGQGITYAANIWHHPMTVLDRPATFAIFMWLARGAGDEEFMTLPEPVTIHL
jgi:ureidoglycolate lyase